jgi:hypothetical protein
MAEGMADSVSKQKILDVAANYKHLAKRAEDRRTGMPRNLSLRLRLGRGLTA